MTEEPKGITLKDLDEKICLQGGTPIHTISGGKEVDATRKLVIIQALESHKGAGDKFKAFDLGMRFESANGRISISSDESVMIKAAIEEAYAQPGIYVPLCRWLEGA